MNYKKAYVEITNICNLRCDFCPETSRAKTFMSIDRFSHTAREVKKFTDYIYLHLMGEPLLHPHLKELLEICTDHRLKVNITTNGTLLKEKTPDLLAAPSLRKVSVSLHSFEANTGVDFYAYLRQVVDFVLLASQKNIICELRLWNLDSQTVSGNHSLNTDIFEQLEQAFQPGFKLKDAIEEKGSTKLRDKVFLHTAERFEWPDLHREVISTEVFCYGLRDQFGVLVDGTVVPCCLDNEGNMSLGNVFEQPLDQILTCERAARIYDGFTARRATEEMCRKCGYAQRYK